MSTSDYLALDLGAESGRGVLGRFDGARLTLEEVHRFPNIPVRMVQTLHWDLPRLFDDAKTALRKAFAASKALDGVGVDAWGVDFGLVAAGDALVSNPVHYRDGRTQGLMEEAFKAIPKSKIYEITGLQFMPINTAYQLMALARAPAKLLDAAETLLMIPDLFGWLLTGRRVGERTNASTTQLYDPNAGTWSEPLCQALGLPRRLLPELIDPGFHLGPILPSISEELGVGPLPVIVPATHDTASAVAAVPAVGKPSGAGPDWCFISSGTWSLLGVETPQPVINKDALEANFTNEAGVDGTTRLLKNIMGLWLVQECRRTWARQGNELTYEELISRSERSRPFVTIIDPDDSSFLAPGDMPGRISAYCKKTGQPAPADEGAYIRTALESLALKYRWTIERLEQILGVAIKTIHVVGGGAKNALLCQLTADASDRLVLAGPVEATAAGNVLIQARATGRIGGLRELREVVSRSFSLVRYEPANRSGWDDAYSRFERLPK